MKEMFLSKITKSRPIIYFELTDTNHYMISPLLLITKQRNLSWLHKIAKEIRMKKKAVHTPTLKGTPANQKFKTWALLTSFTFESIIQNKSNSMINNILFHVSNIADYFLVEHYAMN